jgi:hypothetical protein
VVNATPLGMSDGDPLPFDPTRLGSDTFVGDVVLTAGLSPLLKAVARRGCGYQVGTDMLFEQIPAYLEFFGYGTATPDQLRAVSQIFILIAWRKVNLPQMAQLSSAAGRRFRPSAGSRWNCRVRPLLPSPALGVSRVPIPADHLRHIECRDRRPGQALPKGAQFPAFEGIGGPALRLALRALGNSLGLAPGYVR